MSCPRCGGILTDGVQGRVCSPCGVVLPTASAVAADLLRPKTDSTEFVRRLGTLVRALADAGHQDELEALLLTPSFLEAKVQAGMTFELADDFALALEGLPAERPWRRVLDLLQEALLRDLHFISRHPGALFQCLWNSSWWYDCPEAADRYDPPAGGWPEEGAPWDRPGPKLSPLLESWRQAKDAADPGFVWLRSLRPPGIPLGGPQRVVIPANTDGFRFLDLRFSPDGGRVFAWLNPVGTADVSDRQFRAWSAATGRQAAFDPWEVPSHDPQVSPDGRWRAEYGGEGGGWGRPLRLVEVATGREVASFETDPDVNIQEVRFSPGGERIIGGGWSESGEAMVWNVATGTRLAWLQPFGLVFAVAVSFNSTASSRPAVRAARSCSGTSTPASSRPHSKGTRARSRRWPSHPTAADSRPVRTMELCGSGICHGSLPHPGCATTRTAVAASSSLRTAPG
jgi:hypothetical protein